MFASKFRQSGSLLTVRTRSIILELFKMSDGTYYFSDPSRSKIIFEAKLSPEEVVQRIGLLSTSRRVAIKVTAKASIFYVFDPECLKLWVSPFNPLPKTSRSHGSVEGAN